MARWETGSAEVTELSRVLEREPDTGKQPELRAKLRKLEVTLVALRIEIEAMVKQGAQNRTGTGDSFIMATVYTTDAVSDESASPPLPALKVNRAG